MTPKEAIDSGANQIVVGRPITQAIDSFQATKSIFAEINE
jgi:orotidine-5'-phosphate decarboxylase